MKTVIIAGAGATYSDASTKPLRRRPPLDSGFFAACGKLGIREKSSIISYLKHNYDIDPSDPYSDSLERIMAIIYADISNPLLEKDAVSAFRVLIRLFNRRIAETTNPLKPTNQTNLYRIVAKQFRDGILPSDLTIVTFNQDLQIEKTLARLAKTKQYARLGPIFQFPSCYRIPDARRRTTSPRSTSVAKFTVSDDIDGIAVLKLHGSLNWFSTHPSRNVPKASILNSRKQFRITPRSEIPTDMTFSGGKKTVHTFPLIIPPVNHKAAIIHKDLYPIWKQAQDALTTADRIIVFGYSCPQTDFECANLLRRTVCRGTHPTSFSVIDPNPQVFQRYVSVTNLDHLSYFASADAYIKKG